MKSLMPKQSRTTGHASLQMTKSRAATQPGHVPHALGNQTMRLLLEAGAGGGRARAAQAGDRDVRGARPGFESNDREGGKDGAKGGAKPKGKAPAKAPEKAEVKCTASATGVSLGESGPFNDGTQYGLRTPITVRGKELADVLDSELVGTSIDHTGSMTKRPSAKSRNSEFMAADKIPDDHHGSGIADHLSYFDKHGGDGSYDRLQMDLYKIPKCHIDTPQDMPNSGYRIKRQVKKEGKKVVGIVTKTAEAVTIDGHKSSAGLTAKKEAKVTLRET